MGGRQPAVDIYGDMLHANIQESCRRCAEGDYYRKQGQGHSELFAKLLPLWAKTQQTCTASFVPAKQTQPHSGMAMSKRTRLCYRSVHMMWYSATVYQWTVSVSGWTWITAGDRRSSRSLQTQRGWCLMTVLHVSLTGGGQNNNNCLLSQAVQPMTF